MSPNSDSADKGIEEKAISENSDSSANQKGSSEAEYVSVAEFNKLQSQLETLRRSLQSDKDKGVKKVNARVEALEGDLRTVLQGARKKGQSLEEVLADIEEQEQAEERQLLREMALSFKNGSFQKGSQGSEQSSEVDVSEVVTKLELDKNDMRVKEFMAREFSSKEEVALEAAKLLKTILRTQPTDADKPGEVANAQKNASQQEKLMQEYQEGSKGLMGQALINYKMAMRKKGLEIS